MTNDFTAATTDAAKALEALPVLTNALAQMQTSLSQDQHKSVLANVADTLNIAAQSAQALGAQGVIGHNDASNIETGVGLAVEGAGLVADIQALAARLKALAGRIF